MSVSGKKEYSGEYSRSQKMAKDVAHQEDPDPSTRTRKGSYLDSRICDKNNQNTLFKEIVNGE
jgi:hypothetical protein